MIQLQIILLTSHVFCVSQINRKKEIIFVCFWRQIQTRNKKKKKNKGQLENVFSSLSYE